MTAIAAGRGWIKAPKDLGRVQSLALNTGTKFDPQAFRYLLVQVSIEEISRHSVEVRARPVYFALDEPNGTILVRPIPDKRYEIVGHYYPHMKEF